MMRLGLSDLVNTSTLLMKFLIFTRTGNSYSSFSIDQHGYSCIFFHANMKTVLLSSRPVFGLPNAFSD